MLERLTTEARNPNSEAIDRLSAMEIVELLNQEDAGIAAAVEKEKENIASAVDVVATALRNQGRLIYLGAGTSGRLGVLDASECPPTFNTDPEQVVGIIAGGYSALTRSIEGAEDFPEQGQADLRDASLTSKDVVFGIATSGRTPYVIGGLRYARQIGCQTIGLACNRDSELKAACDIYIAPVVGPEVISGSTRMKAGTATKMVLNCVTTGAMVLLGKTYGNLMVDLRASNSKLVDRSLRILKELTGVDDEKAEQLLARCDGELKTAIVSEMVQVEPEIARQRLADAKGHLRLALSNDAHE